MMTIAQLIVLLIQLGLAAAVLSFWGWLATTVIKQGSKLVELEQQVVAITTNCGLHHEWSIKLDEKLSKMGNDISFIKGKLDDTATR